MQLALRWIHKQGATAICEKLDIFAWELSQKESDKISQIPQRRLYKAEMLVSENGMETPEQNLCLNIPM